MPKLMTATRSSLAQLVDHIDVLRRQHQAEITPSFGQIDRLFTLSDDVREEDMELALEAGATAPAPACSMPGCGTGRHLRHWMLVAERAWCPAHGLQVNAAIKSFNGLPSDLQAAIARVNWPTPATTGRVTGPDPRD